MNRTIPIALLLLALLSGGSLLLTQPVINSIRTRVETTSELTANLISGLALTAISLEDIRPALWEVITRVDFPILITDHRGYPKAWKEVGVDPKMFTPRELDNPELLAENPDYQKLLAARDRLGEAKKPISVDVGGAPALYLYYGEPQILTYLKVLPFLLAGLSLLTFLGFVWAARSVRSYQAEAFWANFAKGLAHQMGTPVSSLYGWLEIVRKKEGDERLVSGLERDLTRLRSILRRFSKIGSVPQFQPVDLREVLQTTAAEAKVRFLKERLCELKLVLPDTPALVDGEPELLSWAFEILLKNAYEARRDEGAVITVELSAGAEGVTALVKDNGSGIPRDKQRALFKRSFTTKEKGWGVGLILVNRIVHELHHGKIGLKYSDPERGTCFSLQFKGTGRAPHVS